MESTGIIGSLEGVKVYCQSKDVQFGAYVEFDHEPDKNEVVKSIARMSEKILRCVNIRCIDAFEVFLKTPEDFKNAVLDPLYQLEKDQPDRWTVGVKISCRDAGYGSPCKYKLEDGVCPEPMEI